LDIRGFVPRCEGAGKKKKENRGDVARFARVAQGDTVNRKRGMAGDAEEKNEVTFRLQNGRKGVSAMGQAEREK